MNPSSMPAQHPVSASYFQSFFLFLACIFLPCIHGIAQQHTGHLLINPTVDPQAAAARKKEILQISNDLFEAAAFTGRHDTMGIHYRLLRPSPTTPGHKYPLVVIFHGSGATGTDNIGQMGVLVKMWAQQEIRNQYPAFVVAVQFPQRSSNYAKNADSLLVSVPGNCLATALELIDSLQKVLPVDARKIYAMGFSMGASTVNNAIIARPGLFAAGICISGIPKQEGMNAFKNTPLWMIHGNADTENPIDGDRVFYKRLSAMRSANVLFWEINGLQHETYAPLYMTDAVPKWLFAQRKKK